MNKPLLDRLASPGPKRILALDGGGIRGALTLGFLMRIEELLRDRHGAPDTFRLRDYFDLIGGTSTGAIIAAGLAIGKSATEIKDIYLTLGGRVFSRVNSLLRQYWWRFDETVLVRELRNAFGDETLGSDQLTTGLCIITKRADTGSMWPLFNHPRGKYYGDNKDIKIWQALRASTAAPTFFRPQDLPIGNNQLGAFVDGGFSMANNPALQLFLSATLKGYPFHWTPGEDRLLVTSIGTGIWHRDDDPPAYQSYGLYDWARLAPDMFMEDMMWFNQMLLQAFSRSPTAVRIDSEIGALDEDYIGGTPLLSYLRYNVELSHKGLRELGFERLIPRISRVREMALPHFRKDLFEMGAVAADRQIEAGHFPPAFNLPSTD